MLFRPPFYTQHKLVHNGLHFVYVPLRTVYRNVAAYAVLPVDMPTTKGKNTFFFSMLNSKATTCIQSGKCTYATVCFDITRQK